MDTKERTTKHRSITDCLVVPSLINYVICTIPHVLVLFLLKAPPNNPAGEDRVYPFEALLSDAGDKVEVTVFQLLDADTVASQRYSFLVKVRLIEDLKWVVVYY